MDKAKVVPLNWVVPPGHNLVGIRGMHLWSCGGGITGRTVALFARQQEVC